MPAAVLVEVQEVPGHGRGLVAARQLKPGDCIIDEEALVWCPRSSVEWAAYAVFVAAAWRFFGSGYLEAWFGWILAVFFGYRFFITVGQYLWVCWLVFRLDSTDRKKFDNLCNPFPSTALPFVDTLMIWRTNAMPAGNGRGAVFASTCMINHSCAPNAYQYWDTKKRRMLVHCMKTVKKGEEITISYIDVFQKTQDRREALWNQYRFNCECPACSLPDERKYASDDRRARCSVLHLGAARRVLSSELERSMAEVEEFLKLLDEEFGDPSYKGEVLLEVSELYRRQKKLAQARSWAAKAHKSLELVRGASCAETQAAKRAASQ
eukprot:TRINITY_DN24811_c0_g1_i1.p1 TRINITY_DN24811_c0_g1~~TRINITY_DN24811_c0_g1_i1.p1  ORF type:complete len:322 (-),score=71.71 TRINITY_DN24811_c0_g1_i1:22-987(-)